MSTVAPEDTPKILRSSSPALLADEEKRLRKLLLSVDWNLSRAGKEIGRSAGDVWRMLRRFPTLEAERQEKRAGAVKSGRKPIISSPRQLRDAMRAAGWDLGKAARKLKASERTVRDWIVKTGMEETYLRMRKAAN